MPAERDELRIGISACLLGERVRYDGGHKRDEVVCGLARLARLVPVCPEVELGLGTPREPIRLERRGEEVHLVALSSRLDHTEAMRRFAGARARELERLGLSGYVFKESSPSCGLEHVAIWDGERPAGSGRGLFAEALLERLPMLPVEEESRLHDPRLLESFLERVRAFRRSRLR